MNSSEETVTSVNDSERSKLTTEVEDDWDYIFDNLARQVSFFRFVNFFVYLPCNKYMNRSVIFSNMFLLLYN